LDETRREAELILLYSNLLAPHILLFSPSNLLFTPSPSALLTF